MSLNSVIPFCGIVLWVETNTFYNTSINLLSIFLRLPVWNYLWFKPTLTKTKLLQQKLNFILANDGYKILVATFKIKSFQIWNGGTLNYRDVITENRELNLNIFDRIAFWIHQPYICENCFENNLYIVTFMEMNYVMINNLTVDIIVSTMACIDIGDIYNKCYH